MVRNIGLVQLSGVVTSGRWRRCQGGGRAWQPPSRKDVVQVQGVGQACDDELSGLAGGHAQEQACSQAAAVDGSVHLCGTFQLPSCQISNFQPAS